MIETLVDAITALRQEGASYPQGVQLWMKIMAAFLFASVLFVYAKPASRWILAALLFNILGLVIGKSIFPEFSRTDIGTVVHLAIWPGMLWGVWHSIKKSTAPANTSGFYNRAYIGWLFCACAIMVTSLILDFRNLLHFMA